MELPPIPGADDRIDFLEYHGFVAIEPTIRSSDYYDACQNPFKYYLRRRLGLVSPLSISDALSHGSWFHAAAELRGDRESFDRRLDARINEMRALKDIGMSGSLIKDSIDQERRRALEALTWYKSASSIKFRWKGEDYTSDEFLSRPRFRILGTEIPFTIPLQRMEGVFDLLLLDLNDNTVHVWDWKTTGEDPIDRVVSCPWEFQTQHYVRCLELLLRDTTFRDTLRIPDGAVAGGMYHLAVGKPSIKLCDRDRDFKEVTREITRGPNKGQQKTERKYFGEPKLANYLNRVEEYYQTADRPVVLSHTSFPFPEEIATQYLHRLDHLRTLARMSPDPMKYLSYPITGARAGALDTLAYTPIHQWPTAIREMHLIVHHR